MCRLPSPGTAFRVVSRSVAMSARWLVSVLHPGADAAGQQGRASSCDVPARIGAAGWQSTLAGGRCKIQTGRLRGLNCAKSAGAKVAPAAHPRKKTKTAVGLSATATWVSVCRAAQEAGPGEHPSRCTECNGSACRNDQRAQRAAQACTSPHLVSHVLGDEVGGGAAPGAQQGIRGVLPRAAQGADTGGQHV